MRSFQTTLNLIVSSSHPLRRHRGGYLAGVTVWCNELQYVSINTTKYENASNTPYFVVFEANNVDGNTDICYTRRMNVRETLQHIGLSEREVSVYLASLALGADSVQHIARRAGEKRSTVYETIAKLKARGLMTETRRGARRRFAAAPPGELYRMLRERERALEAILPTLKGMAREEVGAPHVRVFVGPEELRAAYNDTLAERVSEIRTIASASSIVEWLGWDWIDAYVAERVRKNIRVRLLTTDSDAARRVAARDRDVLRQTRLLPARHNITTDIEIYGDKALFLSLGAEATAVLIESPAIARALTVLFDLLWQGAQQPVQDTE